MHDAEYWITSLNLSRHTEGGFFRETYRAQETIEPHGFAGPRAVSTAIYFLLKGNECSRLHRIKSDELWHFYSGSALTIHSIDGNGTYVQVRLGCDPGNGAMFQALARAGYWFGATVDDPGSYSLVGCTVAPGFDFDDFETANRTELTALYPQHKAIIEKLTKPGCPESLTAAEAQMV